MTIYHQSRKPRLLISTLAQEMSNLEESKRMHKARPHDYSIRKMYLSDERKVMTILDSGRRHV